MAVRPPRPPRPPRDPIDEGRYPNLAAERALDRAQHVRLAMASGMSREEAERHADADLADRED